MTFAPNGPLPICRAASEQENGGESEAPSRARTSSPEPRQSRPSKRRKVYHSAPRAMTFPDGEWDLCGPMLPVHVLNDLRSVVTKKVISEAEARELFRM